MSKLSHLLALLASLAAIAPLPSRAGEAVPAIFALPADFYPESMDAGPDGTLYIGSWHQGAIARLSPGQAVATLFVPPGSNGLTNTQGVLVDAARQTLWACSGNLGYTSVPRHPSALKAFDLASGAAKASYDLPGGGYCNDLALGREGRIYVTDSLHPRVLQLADVAGQLQPWAEDKRFCAGGTGFCLNGVTVDPAGTVYVSTVDASADLFKVSVGAKGEAGAAAPLHFPRVLKNADGLRFLAPDRLLVFESNAFAKNDPLDGGVSLATLGPGGVARLETLVNGLADPSSGLAHGGRVYFMQSKYSILLRHPADDMSGVPGNVPFVIESVPLPASAP